MCDVYAKWEVGVMWCVVGKKCAMKMGGCSVMRELVCVVGWGLVLWCGDYVGSEVLDG